jgi:hypothetical protein
MRCPKCGYISFDNLDSCLKCSKNISDATRAFQGSTLKVNTPSFLKISVPDENELQIEGAAEVGGEIEFTDPDLEILIDDEGERGEIDFNLDSGDDADEGLPIAGDFDEVATFGEDEDGGTDLSADLGQFEDVPDDDTFSFEDLDDEAEESVENDAPAMDLPDELDDISDLLPPESPAADEPLTEPLAEINQSEPMEAAAESGDDVPLAEPEDDLDFCNLDFELNGAEEAVSDQEGVADTTAPAADPEEAYAAASVNMDEDLDFNLDLGGLTIKDDK